MAKLNYRKVILFGSGLFVLFSSIPLLATKLKDAKVFKQVTYNDQVTLLKEELGQFKLEVGNFDKTIVYASKYASSPMYLQSSVNTPRGDTNFWANQLILKKQLITSDLNQEKLFGLNHAKGRLLNFYQDKYNLSFYSYANDLTGTLYLKLILNPKGSKTLNTQVEYIYKLNGFKPYDEVSYSQGMFIKEVLLKEDVLKSEYPTLADFEAAYNNVKANAAEKISFYTKVFSYYGSSSSSMVIPSSIELSFDHEKNTILFSSKLRAIINEAKEDDLSYLNTLDTNISASYTLKYPTKSQE